MTEGFPWGPVVSEENGEAAPGEILVPLVVVAAAQSARPHLPPLPSLLPAR